MKTKYSVAIIALVIFFSCSKDKDKEGGLCLKIKVIGFDYCSPVTMGAQVLEGPHIGEVYGNYDNVIEICGVDKTKFSINSVLYVTVRDKKDNDNIYGICPAIYPMIVFSKVIKIPLSFSMQPCH